MQARKLFAALSLAAIPMLGANRDWKTATLTETNRVEHSRQIGQQIDGRIVQSTGVTTNQAYTLDLGDRIVVCEDPDFSWVRIRAVPVDVGSQIRYVRVANSALLFLDSKGKEHKCFIQHEALKPTPAP